MWVRHGPRSAEKTTMMLQFRNTALDPAHSTGNRDAPESLPDRQRGAGAEGRWQARFVLFRFVGLVAGFAAGSLPAAQVERPSRPPCHADRRPERRWTLNLQAWYGCGTKSCPRMSSGILRWRVHIRKTSASAS